MYKNTDNENGASGRAEVVINTDQFFEAVLPEGDGVMRLVFQNQAMADLWRERLEALA